MRGKRSSLLFLSQCLPYPPTSGVTNRTFHIACELQREFDVTLLAFSRRRHQPSAGARSEATEALANSLTAVIPAIPIPGEQSLARRVADHSRSVLTRRPYTYYEYSARAFAAALDSLLLRTWDLVHMDSLDLFRWIDRVPSAVPVAVTHHSIESQLLRLRADRAANALTRSYLRYQAELIESVEREYAQRVAMNVMMSQIDAERLLGIAPDASVAVVPNGVDLERLKPAEGEPVPGRIAFLGPLYMFPNADGVRHFLSAIWPQVRAENSSAHFQVVGAVSPDHRREFGGTPGVELLGFVPDLRPLSRRQKW